MYKFSVTERMFPRKHWITVSSFLSSEISSRAEDMLFTFLLSISVEHTDPHSKSLFHPDIEESVANSYLGISPSSFAAGRVSRKKPFYMTKWELQVMMPWQTPHFNPFTKPSPILQGQYLLSSSRQLLVGFHLPRLLGIKWHTVTALNTCILNFSPKTFFFPQSTFVSLHLNHSLHCERKKSWL